MIKYYLAYKNSSAFSFRIIPILAAKSSAPKIRPSINFQLFYIIDGKLMNALGFSISKSNFNEIGKISYINVFISELHSIFGITILIDYKFKDFNKFISQA